MVPNRTDLGARVTDALYTEALLLADEARGYFDGHGRAERDTLPAAARIGFSCESLRATTRLMHIVAWLLNQRAVAAGEISAAAAAAEERRLGSSPASDPAVVESLPDAARALIARTEDLYARVAWLDTRAAAAATARPSNPVLGLIATLQNAF